MKTNDGNDKAVVVITGAGRREGIGFELARQLGARGMTVVITARSAEAARARADELAQEGLDVVGEPLDVASTRPPPAAM